MTTEQKIEAIKEALAKGAQRQSKIDNTALSIPFLGCLNARHVYNNLGSLSTHYGEIGSHRGGSLCSAVYKNENLLTATAIDSFLSDETEAVGAKPDFLNNSSICLPPQTKLNLIHQDSFQVDLSMIQPGIDMFLMDGSHDEDSQCRALTYYLPIFADEFIFIVDDSDWVSVIEGTQRGLKETEVEILFEQKFESAGSHDNESWFNGMWVFYLKKKTI